MLSVNNLCIRKKNTEVLRDVSFTLDDGEILAIVGPNGAGKTSLLKGIIEKEERSDGSVEFGKGNIIDWGGQELARSIAVLPQLSLLNFPYRVEEVVGLGRIPHATGIDIDKQIVDEAIAAMDITSLRRRLYTQLSGGEKQRTQLARVMAQIWREEDGKPRLLLLDEPTSALDLGHQQQLMAAVKDFAAQGVAVIMVVHDVNIAAKYAHRILALSEGKVLADGAPTEVLTAELLHQLYNAHVKVLEDPESQTKVIVS